MRARSARRSSSGGGAGVRPRLLPGGTPCRPWALLILAVLLAPGFPGRAGAEEGFRTERVLILVVDGLRYEDAFVGAAAGEMPNIVGDLRARGAFCTRFYNLGPTNTTPGHAAAITGVRLPMPVNRLDPDNVFAYYPTLFECYRAHLLAQGVPLEDSLGRVVQIYGKQHECRNLAASLHPAFGQRFASRIRFPDRESGSTGAHRDARVYRAVLEELEQRRPDLLLANLAGTDQRAHYGDRFGYEFTFRKADEFVAAVWRRVQSLPEYRDRTTLFVLSDHGRHDDEHGGPRHHGDSCHGCRQSWLLVLGPDVRPGVTCNAPHSLVDLCTTVSGLLGFEMPFARGRFLSELFLSPPPQTSAIDPASVSRTAGRSRAPSLAASGEQLALGWLEFTGGRWRLAVRRSEDAGRHWGSIEWLEPPGRPELTSVDLALEPDGTLRVLLAGQPLPSEAHAATPGRLWLGGLDPPEAWSLATTGMLATPPKIRCTDEGAVVAWSFLANNPAPLQRLDGRIHFGRLDPKGLRFTEFLVADELRYPRSPRIAVEGERVHLVAVTYDDLRWNVLYARSEDGGAHWTTTRLSDSGPRDHVDGPDVTAVGDTVVVVYRRRLEADGRWRLITRRSLDGGLTWAPPEPLAGDLDVGEPCLARSGETIAAAWTVYQHGATGIHGAFTLPGSLEWGPEQVLVPAEGWRCAPDLEPLPDGFALAWEDQSAGRSEIYWRRLPFAFADRGRGRGR